MKLRFAPSPTGYLHVGNARTLLLNWLYAKKHGATFFLRFDDTDLERSRDDYADQIRKDLAWLGLTYDQEIRQSDRLPLYQQAAEKLKSLGRLYPCYETKEELDFKRKRQLAQGRPPLYDRAALRLSPETLEQYQKEGRLPHWRFKLEASTMTWHDLAHGPLSFKGEHLSDPILIRENGAPVFTLSGIVDDLDMGITHIIRGDDHITNTAIQLQIFEALGGKSSDVTLAHVPLLTGMQGEGLSKRLGSLSLKDLKEEGLEPLALLNYLSTLGMSEDIDIGLSLEGLAKTFDLSKLGRSAPKFSREDLDRVNAKVLHKMPFSFIKERLMALGFKDISEAFWETIKGNLSKLDDIALFGRICFSEITPTIEDADYLKTAKEALPPEPWDHETWVKWTTRLKEETGRKGKALFMPLRQALTGEDHGPEMQSLLPFIGYDKALKRLSGQKA